MERVYKQRGYNGKFPEEVKVWIKGSIVPEWLSNVSKVVGMNSTTGDTTIETRELSAGGYEIIDSSGTGTLVRTKSEEDYVCFGRGSIFSLSPKQFKLLYDERVF